MQIYSNISVLKDSRCGILLRHKIINGESFVLNFVICDMYCRYSDLIV